MLEYQPDREAIIIFFFKKRRQEQEGRTNNRDRDQIQRHCLFDPSSIAVLVTHGVALAQPLVPSIFFCHRSNKMLVCLSSVFKDVFLIYVIGLSLANLKTLEPLVTKCS